MGKKTKIVSIINQKGGVGKTTTSINLATALSMFKKDILIVDFDPQANLSMSIRVEEKRKNVYSLLAQSEDIDNVVHKTFIPGVDVIPADQNLAAFNIEVVNIDNKEYLLDKSLQKLKKHYDYVFIDCAPSLTQLTVNALTASDSVLIPLQCEFFALKGIASILKVIDTVRSNLNSKLSVEGIVLTMYNKEDILCRKIADDVRKNFNNTVYNQVIPRDAKLSEASSYGNPVILHNSNCSGSIAYILLAQEMLTKQEMYDKR